MYAISLMCSSRVEYFINTLQAITKSAKKAIENGCGEFALFIFQDDIEAKHDEVLEVARYIHKEIDAKIFPGPVIYFKNQRNYHIAAQWFRAIDFPLTMLDYDSVFIFEDDLVINEGYLETMVTLEKKFRHDVRIGIFSCHNGVCRGAEPGYCRMGHDWGFGINKRVWADVRDLFIDYQKNFRFTSYADRNSAVIKSWVERIGCNWHDGHEGADSALEYIIAGLKKVRCSLRSNMAWPIGISGIHFTPDVFHRMFDGLVVVDDACVNEFNDADFTNIFEHNLVLSYEKFNAYKAYLKTKNKVDDDSNLLQELLPSGDYVLTFNRGNPLIKSTGFTPDWQSGPDGGLFFGPYVNLDVGSYIICIWADNELSCDITINAGIESVLGYSARMSEKVHVASFSLKKFSEKVEFLVKSNGANSISKIQLYKSSVDLFGYHSNWRYKSDNMPCLS